jgi:methyl-accepting chemotaxis protein
MKALTLISVLAAILLVLPLATVYAAGTITFTSPASGTSLKGTQSYTIAGTISPAPGQLDNVFITVKNPNGNTVDAANVPANPTTGAFSYNTATGGSSQWVSGTYTITATDSYGATGSTTFSYTSSAAPSATGAQLIVQVAASSPVFAGQTAEVTALVFWNNGTLAQPFVKVMAHFHDPTGVDHELGNGTRMMNERGMYIWTLSPKYGDGLYFVVVNATTSSVTAWGSAGFTFNSQLASQSTLNSLSSNVTKGLSSLQSSVSTLSSALSQLQSSVSGLATTLGNIQSSLGSLTSTVGSINAAVGQLQQSASGLATTLGNIQSSLTSLTGTAQNLSSQIASISSKVDNAATQASNAANAVGTTQLYVLIVAVLAAITLVLELAILIRKLS